MIKETKIKINGNELTVKNSFKSLLEFENVTGKSVFEVSKSLTDTITMFYCSIKVNNKIDFNLPEFVDMIEADQNILEQYLKFIKDSSAQDGTKEEKKKE